MPSFPCDACGKSFPNTYQMRKCIQQCAVNAPPEKVVSSADRPPSVADSSLRLNVY